jgi:4-hydroxy-3-methylbut-2-enyl diphosphate reductase
VFGDPNHPEVKGLLGWSGDKALATTSAADVKVWQSLPARLGIVSQTTNTLDSFRAFLNAVIEVVFPAVREIRIMDTTCRVTRRRQEVLRELALRSDLLVVVGGKNSANTRRLAEMGAAITPIHAVESAEEIMGQWLKGKSHIGIVAGTSTPDDVVTSIEARLKELAG